MAGIQALSMMCGGHHRSCALATNEMPLVALLHQTRKYICRFQAFNNLVLIFSRDRISKNMLPSKWGRTWAESSRLVTKVSRPHHWFFLSRVWEIYIWKGNILEDLGVRKFLVLRNWAFFILPLRFLGFVNRFMWFWYLTIKISLSLHFNTFHSLKLTILT